MSKGIVISVACGILAGVFLIPNLTFGQAFLDMAGNLIIITLSLLLFLVGFEIGRDITVKERIKKVGFRVFLFPVAAIIGTYVFAAAVSVFLPFTPRETIAASGGFGWYSLAPSILMAHSATLSAVCFLHNVMRELLGIVLIPIVAAKIGYIESTALPGVAVSDVCLPVVEKSASRDVAIYAILMGWIMCLTVPFVGIIVGV